MDVFNGKINIEKIDLNLLFKGEKGTYLSISVIPCPNNDYSSHMITQSLSEADQKYNQKIRSQPNFDKQDLILPKVIGSLNIVTISHSLTEEEKLKVFQK